MPVVRRRQNARFWIERQIDRWDELAFQRDWHERWWIPETGFLSAVFRRTCRVFGHDVIDDHCGRPEHRYCQICYALTPAENTA